MNLELMIEAACELVPGKLAVALPSSGRILGLSQLFFHSRSGVVVRSGANLVAETDLSNLATTGDDVNPMEAFIP